MNGLRSPPPSARSAGPSPISAPRTAGRPSPCRHQPGMDWPRSPSAGASRCRCCAGWPAGVCAGTPPWWLAQGAPHERVVCAAARVAAGGDDDDLRLALATRARERRHRGRAVERGSRRGGGAVRTPGRRRRRAAAGAWGARLASHLWSRVRREGEDGRYRALRGRWHGDQRKLFAMFQLQALLIALFALPFLAVAGNPRVVPAALMAAVAIWLMAVAGETLADRQLARFRADPANLGRTCRSGLWRCSRHPNYFFEWLHWFAYAVLAIGAPLWWLAWSGPLVMYVFLRYLSGIPFTEAHALENRGDDYRAYQRSTPMLFPWFPKSSDDATRSVS